MCVFETTTQCVSLHDGHCENRWRKKKGTLNCLTASIWEDGTAIQDEEEVEN